MKPGKLCWYQMFIDLNVKQGYKCRAPTENHTHQSSNDL